MVGEGESVSLHQPLVRLVGYEVQEAEVALLEEKVKTALNRVAQEHKLREMRLADAKTRQAQTETRDFEAINVLEHDILSLTAELKYQSRELERSQTLEYQECRARPNL